MMIEILEKIENVGSRLEKERLLKQLDESSLRFVKWTLDPIITFGVTANGERQEKSFAVTNPSLERHDFWVKFDKLCDNLYKRNLSGNNALNAIDTLLSVAPSVKDIRWACRVLNKDLRSGFGITTANKVFPGLIEPFACSLAKAYDPAKHDLPGSWIIEPKLDGLRMVIVDGVPFTRNGRVIESVGHVVESLAPYKDKFVFDGEIMGNTEFDSDSGKIRKKGNGPNEDLVYNVFDVIGRNEWFDKETKPLSERKKDLDSLAFSSCINVVKYTKLVNPTLRELFQIRDEMMKSGFEGSMLKDFNSPYIFERSDSLLKLKNFVSADCRIVHTYEGRGRLKGKLGGISVELDGVITNVGSGFSDSQREDLWARREEILGDMVEVQYQNKTPDGKLRFSVFNKFRKDKD